MTEESQPDLNLSRFGDVNRLAALIARCSRTSSAYYERHLGASGTIEPAEIAARWLDVPATTKRELLADQEDRPPYGTRMIADTDDLHLVVESSGSTSGIKEVHALTAADEATVTEMMASAFRRIGVGRRDVVAITLPIGTAGGGTKVYHTVRALGALALRIGSVSTEEKVDELLRFRPTAIVATPSYLDRLSAAARDRGASAAQIGARRLIVATQAMSVEWIRRTEKTWNAKVYEWYGNASGFFAMSCQAGVLDKTQWGTLHWDPAFQLLEVLDADGRLVEDGHTGELVGTHLANDAAPLIRYRLGDEAEFVAAGRCSCGNADLPGVKAGSVRRADGMVKFRGVSLWPSAVDRALDEVPGVDSSWIVLRQDRDAAETADLYVRPATGSFDFEQLGALVRNRTGVRFNVVPWTEDDAPPECRAVTASGKSPRWIDKRQLGASDRPVPADEGAKQ